MEKFKEKRIVNLLNGLGIAMIVVAMLMFLLYTNNFLYISAILLFSSIPIVTVAYFLSGINRYSNEFIRYMRDKLNEATTLEDFIKLESEFNELALVNGYCFLSHPNTIKEIGMEIYNKVDILTKCQNKNDEPMNNAEFIREYARVHKENADKGVIIEEMREALEEAKKELEYHNWQNTRTYFKIVGALNHND